jgi:hypothetical protein
MLKQYIFNGHQYQYEEGEQPEGAVELKAKAKAVEPPAKAKEPANKAVKPANKTRKAVKKS